MYSDTSLYEVRECSISCFLLFILSSRRHRPRRHIALSATTSLKKIRTIFSSFLFPDLSLRKFSHDSYLTSPLCFASRVDILPSPSMIG